MRQKNRREGWRILKRLGKIEEEILDSSHWTGAQVNSRTLVSLTFSDFYVSGENKE